MSQTRPELPRAHVHAAPPGRVAAGCIGWCDSLVALRIDWHSELRGAYDLDLASVRK